MDRRVFKWHVSDPTFDDSIGSFPKGKVVLVAAQETDDTLPTLWIEQEVDTDEYEAYVIKGTGHAIEDDTLEHVGSCLCRNGTLVWHIYKVVR